MLSTDLRKTKLIVKISPENMQIRQFGEFSFGMKIGKAPRESIPGKSSYKESSINPPEVVTVTREMPSLLSGSIAKE